MCAVRLFLLVAFVILASPPSALQAQKGKVPKRPALGVAAARPDRPRATQPPFAPQV
jgi:hypothetical protein